MPKGRLREVNNYLLYSLMSIITFSGRTVGVMSKPGEGRQDYRQIKGKLCLYFSQYSHMPSLTFPTGKVERFFLSDFRVSASTLCICSRLPGSTQGW